MKPGRELDELIAEKVIGIKLCPETAGHTYYVFKEGSICQLCGGSQLYPYSSYMGPAWEVVEKLRGETHKNIGYREFQIHEGSVRGPDGLYTIPAWSAGWGSYGADSDFGLEIFATEVSLPHAICLAALKAVGE